MHYWRITELEAKLQAKRMVLKEAKEKLWFAVKVVADKASMIIEFRTKTVKEFKMSG